MSNLFNDRRLLLVIGVSIPMLALAFVKPIGFDNAIYQGMAIDLYRYGKLPYIGSWDHNFPGIIYIHYLAILIFGTSDLSIRWFDTIVQLLFAGFLYRFWLRWLRPNTAALTAILYMAYYTSADGNRMLAERDVYAGMAIFISIWFIALTRERMRSTFSFTALAGLIAGFAVLFRPTGLLPVAILGVMLLLSNECRIEWRQWPQPVIFLLASLVPLGTVLGYYVTIPGGLEAFYLTTIRWNLDLYANGDNGLVLLALMFARRALLMPIAIYAFIKRRELSKFFAHALSRWEILLYISLTAAAFAIGLGMRKYFDYHFAPFYMLLMPLPALGIELMASHFTRPLTHHYVKVLGVYLATFLAFIPKSPFAFGLALTMKQNPIDFTYAAQYPNPYWGAEQEWAVRRYLNSPVNREGSVAICSFIPYLELHMGRACVGNFMQLRSLAFRLNPDEDTAPPRYTDYQIRWQRNYIDSFRIEKPHFIILARNTHFGYLEDVYNDCLKYLPGFDNVLSSSYRYDTAFGGYQIFRLRSDSTIRN